MVCNLKWLLVFCASLVGMGICGALGLLHELWTADPTRISFLILLLYLMVSPFIGWLTWQSSAGKHELRRRYAEACRFATNLSTQLGLLGNSAGLLFLCSVLAKVDAANPASMQTVVPKLSHGLAIAAASTFIGLLCAALLQLQLVNLNLAGEPQ